MNTAATFERFLGGATALGRQPASVFDWEALIHEGVPARSMEALKAHLALSDAELARLLGVSEKTLSRARRSAGRLDAASSDRLVRVARMVALAAEVLEDEAAAVRWLQRAQIGLGGRIPLTLLTTDIGRDQIEKLLLRIEHGVYS